MALTANQQQASGPARDGKTGGGHGRKALWLLLVLAALGWFAFRGPYRGMTGSADLRLIYAQSRAWLEGRNPYRHEDLHITLGEQGIDVSGRMSRDYWPAIYPPTMHPLMAPLAMLSWPAARAVWLAVNIAALGVLIGLLWQWAGWTLRDRRGWCLVVLTLLLAPLHTGFSTGQLTLLSLTLGLAAGALDRRGRVIWAGVLLGVGVALKPQVAGVVWLWLLLEGRWRTCLWSFVVPLLAGGLGATVLHLNDVPWMADLRRNLADNAVGGGGDPTAINPLRYQLLNLQWPLHEFLADRHLVSGLVMGMAMAVTAAAAVAARRTRDGSGMLLLAVLATLSLLVVYRRMYDAALLLPAVAAVLAGWGRWPRWSSWLSLAVVLTYLTPGAAMLAVAAQKARLPAAVVESRWWWGIVMAGQVWLTLLLTVLLLDRLLRPSVTAALAGPGGSR